MRKTLPIFLALVALLVCQASLRAQSLAEVAKAEEARRKTVKAPAKVYTNDDLKGGGNAGGTPAPPATATPPPAAASQPGAKPADPTAKPDQQKPVVPDETKTEKYWKDRVAAIQQTLSRNKVLLDALQSRLNALNTDFVNIDDPGQRAVIQENIKTAQAEAERVKQDTEKQTKAAADIQEEARKAGVPPGWLR